MSASFASVSSKRYRPRASSFGENLHRRASTAFIDWLSLREFKDQGGFAR